MGIKSSQSIIYKYVEVNKPRQNFNLQYFMTKGKNNWHYSFLNEELLHSRLV